MKLKRNTELETEGSTQTSVLRSIRNERQESSEEIELTEVIPIKSVTTIVNGIRETTVVEGSSPSLSPSSSPPLSPNFAPPLTPPPCAISRGTQTEVPNRADFDLIQQCDQQLTTSASPTNLHFLEIYWRIIKCPDATDNEGGYTCAFKVLCKGCWSLLVALTIFDTLSNIKDSLLDIKIDKSDADATHAKLVTLTYRITQLLLKIAFIIAATKQSCVSAEAFKRLNPKRQQKMTCVPVLVIIATVGVSLGCVVGELGIIPLDRTWSLSGVTEFHFENTYNRIMVWHPSHEQPTTYSAFLYYAGAGLGYMMHFASRLVELSIQSLLLLTTVSFVLEVQEASGHIKAFDQKTRDPNEEEGATERLNELGEKIMKEYENQRDLTKAMNDTFAMFSFIHCTNLTLLVFWGHTMYSSFEIGEFTWAAVEVAIFGTSYFLAICVAIMASGYEEWILKKQTQELMKINSTRLQSLLHEMKNSPIGIGSGILYVNQDFIVKFAVLSFQAFMVLLRAMANNST